MDPTVLNQAKLRIIECANRAFIEHGYAALSMGDLADACGITRRGLYHHFSSKEDLFRTVLRVNNDEAMLRGDQAAWSALDQGAPATDVITIWLDTRFGATRRKIGASKYGGELNDIAFRLALDLMIEVSYETNAKIVALIAELCRCGRLRLHPNVSSEQAGRLIGDGARGVNQARPPVPNDRIRQRYQEIVDAILFGCAFDPSRASQSKAEE